MWDSLVVDFAEDADLAGGCILAHHMGLGKVGWDCGCVTSTTDLAHLGTQEWRGGYSLFHV